MSVLRILLAILALLSFSTLNVLVLASPLAKPSINTNTTTSSNLTPRAPFPKRGLPFNDARYIQHWVGSSSQVNWAYNWDSWMPGNFPWGMEFVPMLWGDGRNHVDVVRSLLFLLGLSIILLPSWPSIPPDSASTPHPCSTSDFPTQRRRKRRGLLTG